MFRSSSTRSARESWRIFLTLSIPLLFPPLLLSRPLTYWKEHLMMDSTRHLSLRSISEFTRELRSRCHCSSCIVPTSLFTSVIVFSFFHSPLLTLIEHATTCAHSVPPTTGLVTCTLATGRPSRPTYATPSCPPFRARQDKGGQFYSLSSSIDGAIIKS